MTAFGFMQWWIWRLQYSHVMPALHVIDSIFRQFSEVFDGVEKALSRAGLVA